MLFLTDTTLNIQSLMGTLYPNFGPDTSVGLIPLPEILLYYAIFFAFGALTFESNDAEERGGIMTEIVIN